MARITTAWYLWRRHPYTNIIYICLAILVAIVVVKVYSPEDDVVVSTDHEKRVVDGKSSPEFVIDPSMPLDGVMDDSLAEWVASLGQEKQDASETERDVSRRESYDQNLTDFEEVLDENLDPLHEAGGKPKANNHDNVLQFTHENAKDKITDNEENSRKLSKFFRKNVFDDRHVGTPLSMGNQEFSHQLQKENPVQRPNLSNMRNSSTLREQFIVVNGLNKLEINVDIKKMATKTDRVNVLIIASMRTGSSFLGELFQQRADFFYMFEPGMLIMHKLDALNLTRGVLYTKLLQMLGDFYRCRFNDVAFFVDLLNEATLLARQRAVPSLVSSQFCREKREPHLRPKDRCDPVSERALEVACKTRANTAIKSIRIPDVNLMLSAVQAPDVNLKLIHLVRDPRSMILSRLRLAMPAIEVFNVTELTDRYRNVLIDYCSSWLQNYEIGHYVPQVRKNYLLVRYEDLALEPYVWARKIYDYVGLGATIPEEIQTWLDENTNGDDPSKKKSAVFSTKRDSKAVLVSWKRKLTLEMAQAIEEVGDCTWLIHATGYRLIGSDLMMLESQDHLVGPLPSPQLNVSAFDFMCL